MDSNVLLQKANSIDDLKENIIIFDLCSWIEFS